MREMSAGPYKLDYVPQSASTRACSDAKWLELAADAALVVVAAVMIAALVAIVRVMLLLLTAQHVFFGLPC